MSLLRGSLAPAPRTLVDILRRTAADHPDEPAVDNGAQVLTYEEFIEAAEEVAAELAAAGIGPGDKVGVRIASGYDELGARARSPSPPWLYLPPGVPYGAPRPDHEEAADRTLRGRDPAAIGAKRRAVV